MYRVYILKSIRYPKTYVGFTSNLKRRLEEHNSGKNFYTRKYKPWELLYYEDCRDFDSTIKREKYFKTAAGRKKIKEILNIGA